jgi:hypothetical protein
MYTTRTRAVPIQYNWRLLSSWDHKSSTIKFGPKIFLRLILGLVLQLARLLVKLMILVSPRAKSLSYYNYSLNSGLRHSGLLTVACPMTQSP